MSAQTAGVPNERHGGYARSAFRRLDEEYIQMGTTKIVVVQRGSIAKVIVNGEGHFLLEGRYVINQGRFEFLGSQRSWR